MMRSCKRVVLVGLSVVLAMAVGGFIAMRFCPTTSGPDLAGPDLAGADLKPPTLESADALGAELSAMNEEIQQLAQAIEEGGDVGIDYVIHVGDAAKSQMLGLLATSLIRYYLDRGATSEAVVQQLTVTMSIRATRAHLELARLKAGE